MPESTFKTPVLVLLGPTASGKTHLAVKVAAMLDGEIISADSRQVYREMDIGTGKDLAEYEIDGRKIPYHLIDIRDAGEQYNVNEFQRDFEKEYHSVVEKEKTPILCGGTGFYILSLLKGHGYAAIPVNDALRTELEAFPKELLMTRFENYNTAYQQLADVSTKKRLIRAIEISEFLTINPNQETLSFTDRKPYDYIVFGLNPAVELRRERISKRFISRLEQGLIAEVQTLLSRGLTPEQLIYYGLEYKWITLYLTGELDYKEMVTRLETEIHRFAKRQMTFFRKMEKDGIEIHWLDSECGANEHAQRVVADYQQFLKQN